MERVLVVDLLHLLAGEGTFGMHVAEILDKSHVWQAYRYQSHELFLPAGLPGSAGVVGLLEGSDVARFALPAPEAPNT